MLKASTLCKVMILLCGERNIFSDSASGCNFGKVELSSIGAVKVCYDNEWEYVCGKLWTDEQAAVVCRQLKLPSVGENTLYLTYIIVHSLSL